MEGVIAIVVVGVVFGGLFFLWKKLTDKTLAKRNEKYTNKHYIDDFAQTCNNETLKQEIQQYKNTEFNKKPSNLFITKNYIITKKLEVIELKKVLWAYKFVRNVVSMSTGNNMGSANKICLLLDNGEKISFYQDSEFLVDATIKEIQEKANWVVIGYTKELENDMVKNLQKYTELKNEKIKNN